MLGDTLCPRGRPLHLLTPSSNWHKPAGVATAGTCHAFVLVAILHHRRNYEDTLVSTDVQSALLPYLTYYRDRDCCPCYLPSRYSQDTTALK
jgi:hypothetical protein